MAFYSFVEGCLRLAQSCCNVVLSMLFTNYFVTSILENKCHNFSVIETEKHVHLPRALAKTFGSSTLFFTFIQCRDDDITVLEK